MPPFNRTIGSAPPASSESLWGYAQLKLERCEERLVLSAIPLFDISHHLVDDPISNSNGFDGRLDSLIPPMPSTVDSSVFPLASVAHEQTGWTDVQRLYGLQGNHQTVAVIDSGIAWDHVSLGKGFGPGYRVVGGWDFAENDAKPYDDAPAGFHGTHVAGIIGADDPTRSGVAPKVDLVALRVFDDAGKGQLAWTESALKWVHQNRNAFASPITTVNLSLGSTWNSDVVPSWGILEDELVQLQQDGIVVVASAGNSFKQYNTPGLSYPAASPYVIPVASVDVNGQLSDFSQRNERVLAAPGRQILSTVPDHVLGSDGIVNDWSVASGTSMAAPYVTGSAVLVRQAMEMVGRSSITPQDIYQWMNDTADSVWDSVTKTAYDRLNLGRAISTLFPTDDFGDHWENAKLVDLQNSFRTNGWINTLGDRDVYRFTPSSDGVLNVDVDSKWLQDTSWSVWMDGQATQVADPHTASLTLKAGHSYAIALADSDQIGSYSLNWNFAPSDPTIDHASPPTDIGLVDYRELSNVVGKSFSLEASHDGLLSIVVHGDHAKNGTLEVRSSEGAVFRDTTLENGQWRIDIDASIGSKWTIHAPSSAGNDADLWIANLVHRNGSTLNVLGTANADKLDVNVSQGLELKFGNIAYSYPSGAIGHLNVDLDTGGDTVRILGSSLSEKVDLRPNLSTIENQQIALQLQSIEQIEYAGGGGSDRVYLDGSTSDDTLTARPRNVELVGSGYRFQVTDIERTYVNGEQGGEDTAYFYDSVGDDRLSVRPQFSSLSGNDFFNYASGFERVYAYSNAGGIDSATLYDSKASDTYYTSGDIASMVGAGFFSYTRFFENVEAISSAGGKDVASVYASDRNSLIAGADLVGYQDTQWSRIARGFASSKTYISSQLIETRTLENSLGWQVDASIPSSHSMEAADVANEAAPAIESVSSIGIATAELYAEVESLLDVIQQTVQESIRPFDNDTETPQRFVTLSELDEDSSIDNLDWPDLERERQMLDEIFARHGLG